MFSDQYAIDSALYGPGQSKLEFSTKFSEHLQFEAAWNICAIGWSNRNYCLSFPPFSKETLIYSAAPIQEYQTAKGVGQSQDPYVGNCSQFATSVCCVGDFKDVGSVKNLLSSSKFFTKQFVEENREYFVAILDSVFLSAHKWISFRVHIE